MGKLKGDIESFNKNWKNREETQYLHWTRGKPKNQIQLAFRQHWYTFKRLISENEGQKKCLEVGCGRGSLSAYFADEGWKCTLLDLSEEVIEQASVNFKNASLKAKFDVADCQDMPYENNFFDLVFSIGLLEHFKDIEIPIKEQVRVLKPGGMFIGYVVPYLPNNVQKDYEWINDLLRSILPNETSEAEIGKTELYRSDELSPRYIKAMDKAGLTNLYADGIYPLPMISHSPEFPFSLLPEDAEKSLVKTFQEWLKNRISVYKENPWLCPEGEGQAFIVWGEKAL